MESLPKILQYPNVTKTTKAACLALKPKLPEIELACGRYAAELGNAVSLGLLDEARLCDRVLTGGFTSGFDQDHFVYSCEQYAANLAKRRKMVRDRGNLASRLRKAVILTSLLSTNLF